MSDKPRILTGDTPTGKLHLGHYVGSVENRLALQDEYDCYFIIANKHAFTTRADRPDDIRPALDKALASNSPAIVEVISDVDAMSKRAWRPSPPPGH